MPTTLEEWCAQARELLGSVRSASRVSGMSNKELRRIRQDFLAVEAPLKMLGKAFPGRSSALARLTGAYGDLVQKLRKSSDANTTRSLHAELLSLGSDIAIERQLAQVSMVKAWQQQLDRVPSLPPRDALPNLQWLERDLERASADTSPEWARQLEVLRGAIAKEREQLPKRLNEAADAAVKQWRESIDEAAVLKGGALLAKMDEIEEGMRALKANFTACGLDVPDAVEKVPLNQLRALYEQGFPKRSTGAKAQPFVPTEQSAPELEREDEEGIRDMLAFYASDRVQMNWFTLKKNYKAGKVSDKEMQQAWAFRQKVVNDTMKLIETRYGLTRGKGWIAVGSVTMESDIDVTILDHHWQGKPGEKDRKILKTDAEIVKEFNDWFLGKYGAQPGIMFDVNLYASAPPRRKLADLSQASPVVKAMASMTNAGQDVGALMKMRRHMSWEDFTAYQNEVVAQMRLDKAAEDDIETTVKQFEEADSLYQISLAESLNTALALIEKRVQDHQKDKEQPQPTQEQLKALEMIRRELDSASKASGAEAQKLLEHAAHVLEHDMADVNMWVNNELYTRGLAEVRSLEEQADRLQQQIDELAVPVRASSDPARELAGVMARLKTLFTDTVFFANEAYHSEGPFQHIVVATQGVKSDLQRKLGREPSKQEIAEESGSRRGGLSVHLLLQSFNEQLGDLLKDLKHYAGEDNPGVGLYRSSKYLQRLLDALALLNGKLEGLDLGFDPSALSEEVNNTLLAARKGNIKFDGIEGAEAVERESQAYAIEQMDRLFSVKTLGEVSAKFKGIGARVNAKARKALAAEMRSAKEEEKAYFPA